MWDTLKNFYLHLSKDFNASVSGGLWLIGFSLLFFLTGSIENEDDNEYTGRELHILCLGLSIAGLISMFNGFLGFISVVIVINLPKILNW